MNQYQMSRQSVNVILRFWFMGRNDYLVEEEFSLWWWSSKCLGDWDFDLIVALDASGEIHFFAS
jgi:hypothetical protein